MYNFQEIKEYVWRYGYGEWGSKVMILGSLIEISEGGEDGYNVCLISWSIKNCVYVSNLDWIYGFLSKK